MQRMGWFLFLCLALLTLPNTVVSQCYDMNSEWDCGWDVEIRSAYVYPTKNLVRKIYRGARFDVEAELSKQLIDRWSAWCNFTYFNKRGHSLGVPEPTTLTLYPLSFGLKYVCPVSCCVDVYAGAGFNYTWMRLFNDSDFVEKHVRKARFGATFKSGIYKNITENLFLDAFVDYLYIPMHLTNVDNVGGFRIGLGLGWRL